MSQMIFLPWTYHVKFIHPKAPGRGFSESSLALQTNLLDPAPKLSSLPCSSPFLCIPLSLCVGNLEWSPLPWCPSCPEQLGEEASTPPILQ